MTYTVNDIKPGNRSKDCFGSKVLPAFAKIPPLFHEMPLLEIMNIKEVVFTYFKVSKFLDAG